MSYYPTKIGKVHPALKFDLLGEMLTALHNEGIEAPIYFPIGWEEVSADNANWLEVNKNGVLGGRKPFEVNYYKWRKLCLNKEGLFTTALTSKSPCPASDIISARYLSGFEMVLDIKTEVISPRMIQKIPMMNINVVTQLLSCINSSIGIRPMIIQSIRSNLLEVTRNFSFPICNIVPFRF